MPPQPPSSGLSVVAAVSNLVRVAMELVVGLTKHAEEAKNRRGSISLNVLPSCLVQQPTDVLSLLSTTNINSSFGSQAEVVKMMIFVKQSIC